MKYLYRWIIRSLARLVLRRHHPMIVAVAGSIGKTATKEAIAASLGTAKRVRKTEGNFNAEVGVPVTIIAGGPPRHGLGWLVAIFQTIPTYFSSTYPEILVLELGTHRVGDLAPLVSLVQPKVAVLTAIAPEHLEFFGDLDAVAQEEASVITMLSKDATGLVNADDDLVMERTHTAHLQLVTFGWKADAQVRAVETNTMLDQHGRAAGQTVKVSIDGSVVSIGLPGVIGKHQAYPVLAALAVARSLNIPVTQAVEGLRQYTPPAGRMRILEGLQGSTLIDDSYNASPHAMVAALETLPSISAPGRRIAILGQMSELGSAAVTWHQWVGERIDPAHCDLLITVGSLAEHIGQAAIEHGFPSSRVRNVLSAEAAAAEVQSELGPNDIVLIKGSRYPKPGYSGFLFRAVKLLLAYPERDARLLVSAD